MIDENNIYNLNNNNNNNDKINEYIKQLQLQNKELLNKNNEINRLYKESLNHIQIVENNNNKLEIKLKSFTNRLKQCSLQASLTINELENQIKQSNNDYNMLLSNYQLVNDDINRYQNVINQLKQQINDYNDNILHKHIDESNKLSAISEIDITTDELVTVYNTTNKSIDILEDYDLNQLNINDNINNNDNDNIHSIEHVINELIDSKMKYASLHHDYELVRYENTKLKKQIKIIIQNNSNNSEKTNKSHRVINSLNKTKSMMLNIFDNENNNKINNKTIKTHNYISK